MVEPQGVLQDDAALAIVKLEFPRLDTVRPRLIEDPLISEYLPELQKLLGAPRGRTG